jgi:D-alanyl-D-alanine carboxypeptidase
MNAKARQLGLFDTSFVEPTGLSDKNVSTARDVARLAAEALRHPEIVQATTKKDYSFTTKEGRTKKISSTDWLLYGTPLSGISLLGGKTGYTDHAGYCFVSKFADAGQHEIISVVLGNGDKNGRFTETKSLVSWIFDSFAWTY